MSGNDINFIEKLLTVTIANIQQKLRQAGQPGVSAISVLEAALGSVQAWWGILRLPYFSTGLAQTPEKGKRTHKPRHTCTMLHTPILPNTNSRQNETDGLSKKAASWLTTVGMTNQKSKVQKQEQTTLNWCFLWTKSQTIKCWNSSNCFSSVDNLALFDIGDWLSIYQYIPCKS